MPDASELLSAVEGMTDEEAAVKPAGGGWSAWKPGARRYRGNAVLRRLSVAVCRIAARGEPGARAGALRAYCHSSRQVEAPESAQPKGRYTTLSDAVGAFLDAASVPLQWLENCDFDLRRRAVEHPALGPASAYEFILIMAAHPARHARQIREGRVPGPTSAASPSLPDGTADPGNRS